MSWTNWKLVIYLWTIWWSEIYFILKMFCDYITVVKEKTIICKLYNVHLCTTHLDNSSYSLQTSYGVTGHSTMVCNVMMRCFLSKMSQLGSCLHDDDLGLLVSDVWIVLSVTNCILNVTCCNITNKEFIIMCYLACIIFLLVIIGVKRQVICTSTEAVWRLSANYALVLRGQPAVNLKIRTTRKKKTGMIVCVLIHCGQHYMICSVSRSDHLCYSAMPGC